MILSFVKGHIINEKSCKFFDVLIVDHISQFEAVSDQFGIGVVTCKSIKAFTLGTTNP